LTAGLASAQLNVLRLRSLVGARIPGLDQPIQAVLTFDHYPTETRRCLSERLRCHKTRAGALIE